MLAERAAVRREEDLSWSPEEEPIIAHLALIHAGGSLLDIGCGRCMLYRYLRMKGWRGTYIGVDIKWYPEMEELAGDPYAKVVIGDALTAPLPRAETVVLYNILEHVDYDALLLARAMRLAYINVLINAPLRNPELWRIGVSEFHQLDKTHKHRGYTVQQLKSMVAWAARRAGRRVKEVRVVLHEPVSARSFAELFESRLAKWLARQMCRLFKSKVFYQEAWMEVVLAD